MMPAAHNPALWAQTPFLASWLAPLLPVLARPDVTDIFINRPGEVWVESVSAPLVPPVISRLPMPELDAACLDRVARQIAALCHQGISREHPLLAANLPDGARVQLVAPPATTGALALAIRKQVVPNLCLREYLRHTQDHAPRLQQGWTSPPPLALPTDTSAEGLADYLGGLVRNKRNIDRKSVV